jgi:hypothetical protein
MASSFVTANHRQQMARDNDDSDPILYCVAIMDLMRG